jgi:hypothetical protein
MTSSAAASEIERFKFLLTLSGGSEMLAKRSRIACSRYGTPLAGTMVNDTVCAPRPTILDLPKLNQIFFSQVVIDGNSRQRPTRDCYAICA